MLGFGNVLGWGFNENLKFGLPARAHRSEILSFFNIYNEKQVNFLIFAMGRLHVM